MPIKIDLVAELQTALTDPGVRAVFTAYIKQAVKEALAERDTDTWLDHRAAAQPKASPFPATLSYLPRKPRR